VVELSDADDDDEGSYEVGRRSKTVAHGGSGPSWPRLLSDFVAVGHATRSGSGFLNPGDSVIIVRDNTPASSSSSVPTGSWAKTPAGGTKTKGKAKAKKKSMFPRKEKLNTNTIVRVRAKGVDVGRLPTEIARWVAPLLDGGVVQIAGICVSGLNCNSDLLNGFQAWIAVACACKWNDESP
jgi:DNA repair protein RAD5